MKRIVALCNLVYQFVDGESRTLAKGVIAEIEDAEADKLVSENLALEVPKTQAEIEAEENSAKIEEPKKDTANGKPKTKNSADRNAGKRGRRKNVSKSR